jgi:hypothetical protein
METSQSTKEIAAALTAFQAEVKMVVKDAVNPFFKSKYASLENVIATIKFPLVNNGLSYVQLPDGDGLTTIVMHKSGEWIKATANLELKGHTPQDQGSAITYMRRYALSAALGLATEDDDDGNAATQASKEKPAAKPVPPKRVADKRDAQKARIKELIDDISLVPLSTGLEYREYVRNNFYLELEPQNYTAIVARLEALQSAALEE